MRPRTTTTDTITAAMTPVEPPTAFLSSSLSVSFVVCFPGVAVEGSFVVPGPSGALVVGPVVGPAVGAAVGPAVDAAVGPVVGVAVGPVVGVAVGPVVGVAVGPVLGAVVASGVATNDGPAPDTVVLICSGATVVVAGFDVASPSPAPTEATAIK